MTSRHSALISFSVLSLALATACPSWAVAKAPASAAKSETVKKTAAKPSDKADADDSDVKIAPKGKTAGKATDKASGKTKTAVALNDDDGKANAKTKSTKSNKTAQLADDDADTQPKKKGSARTKLAAQDEADTANGKKTSKSANTKSTTTKLADADTPAKKTSAKTAAESDDDADADTVKGKESTKTSKAAKLADSDVKGKTSGKGKGKTKTAGKKDATDSDSDSQTLADSRGTKGKTGKTTAKADKSPVKLAAAKSPIATPHIATPPIATPSEKPALIPVALNTAPVPYKLVAGQTPKPAPVVLNAVLSPEDTAHYQAAYALMDQGDFEGADAQLALTINKNLMGYAQFHKLFSIGYESTYEELIDWMNRYGDQPMAMRVWGLAKRKKPEGAPDPAFPLLGGNPDAVIQASAPAPSQSNPGRAIQMTAMTRLTNSRSGDSDVDSEDDNGYASMPMIDANDSDLTPKSARSAYNNGQLEQAVKLGRKIGDHWVAGLACWRLQRYDQALAEFKFVSTDPSRNAWSQSGGAYWAARAAIKLGRQDDAQTYLKIAASFPFTFYGLLAEARLGVTPAVVLSKKGLPPTFGNEQRDALTASLDGDFSWTRTNAQAQRLNALIQIGRASDAQSEMQAAVQRTSNGAERDRWLALAAKMQVSVNQLQPTDRLFDPNIYPIPDFEPTDGYSVDKALLFAFARKESKFDPKAKSYSGAYGLLQLMPATAALVEDDPSFTKKPEKLLKPAINLRVGQKYIQRLFDSKIVSNDLLRTIAAYNSGPRPVKDAVDSLGPDADSLLVMESIPVAQTRQYVEEVAANYWIYRQILDNSSKTLAMAANDATIIDATADSNN